MTGTAVRDVDVPTALDVLRTVAGDGLPSVPLDPVEYAAGHALFEARSDQRRRLTDWLVEQLAERAAGATRVLSVGCGDGTVDVCIARALAARGHDVDYVGVEPHLPSGTGFVARLDAVGGVHATVLTGPFDAVAPDGCFDVVLAVHSLYYVDDLAGTLHRAADLLSPGGVLLVLHAPVEPLNELVRILAPGTCRAFSAEVVDELDLLGLSPQVTRIDNRLDLTETGDADTDRRLLAFTVQATLTPQLQGLVRAALTEQTLPGPGLVVSHPVDALIVHAPDRPDRAG